LAVLGGGVLGVVRRSGRPNGIASAQVFVYITLSSGVEGASHQFRISGGV